MTVSSMTGFARASGNSGAFSWAWEIRSVNGRGLDLRCRFPAGYDGLEIAVRKRVNEMFERGSISVNLRFERASGDMSVRVNERILEDLSAVASRLQEKIPEASFSIDGLLAVRGVIEIAEVEEDESAVTEREKAMLGDLEVTLKQLAVARAQEGARLAHALGELLAKMSECVAAAATAAATQPAGVRARLQAQIAALDERPDALSDERLAQEVVLLAAKADVREELDRLGAHLAAAHELLAEGGPIGRRLDFLAQEFNREANTLVAKSSDLELTALGLELKTAIDQFREQTQNIE